MRAPRRVMATRVLAAAALIAAVAAFWPLPGPTPTRCTYDGDQGSCQALFYRSALTVGIATLAWGSDVVQVPH